MKSGISKQSYVAFIVLGFVLIYFKGEEQEINKIALAIGYLFLVSGFIIGIITNILSIKIEIYEHIIEKYNKLLESNSKSLDQRESMIKSQFSDFGTKQDLPVPSNATHLLRTNLSDQETSV
jgi:hypothetical protein